MEKIITCIFIISLFIGCSFPESYFIQYSIVGSSDNAKVIYIIDDNNYEATVSIPWEISFFINKDQIIGIDVSNLSNGNIDVRVFFTGNGDKQLYKRKIDESHVLIKGKIYSLL